MKKEMMTRGIGIVLLAIPFSACLSVDDTVDCLEDGDCSGGAVCNNGACEGEVPSEDSNVVGAADDTGSAEDDTVSENEITSEGTEQTETQSTEETDTEAPASDTTASKTDPDSSACCADPGALRACWLADAEDDGITCESDEDCLSGTCNTARGVCACDAQSDCDDGEDLHGYCVMSEGYCGPSLCNDGLVCACWGGCAKVTAEDLGEETCTDGDYSIDPDDA